MRLHNSNTNQKALFPPRLAVFLGTIGLSLCANHALAQGEGSLEEVVVRGELRETPTLELANSVSVITEQTLKLREARHLEDALGLAPNVNYATGASRGRYVQIRGIGERSEFLSPFNPSVGILLDGIDFSNVGTGVTGLDVAQTEIFRGPQGTAFGANALAGVINVVGKGVADESGGEIGAGVGNFDSRHIKLVGNAAVSESFGARLAFLHNASDGFVDNTFLNRSDTNNIEESSARLLFEFSPNERVDVSWVNYLVDVNNGYDGFSLDNNRNTLSDQPGKDTQETFATAINVGVDFTEVRWKTTLTGQDSEITYSYDEDWSFLNICPSTSECAFFQYSATDAYDRENTNTTIDTRLISTGEGKFNWVLGLYARDQNSTLDRTRTDNLPNGDPYNPADVPETSQNSFDFDTLNLAIYGESSLSLGNTTITLGARQETRDADLTVDGVKLDERDEHLWGGKLSLQYALNDEQFIYALASRGYKSGGFNPEVFNRESEILRQFQFYDTEYQWNYELGFKGSAFDGRWVSQIALFYQDRKDVQVDNSLALAVDDFVGYIANAGTTRSQGLEIETRFKAHEKLTLIAAIGYLDAEFQRFDSPTHVDAPEGGTYDLSGRQLAHAPSHQYFIAGHIDLSDALYLRLEAEGKSSFYYSDSHNQKSPSYNIANIRLGYEANTWDMALWVKNAFDRDYANRGFYFSNDFGNDPRKLYAPETYEMFSAPRTFGVSGSLRF